MAWITPIGSDPAQVDYRLGLGHGCVAEGVNDLQLNDHTDTRERPLVWVGKALADLGIEAGSELTPEQFGKARALINGYHPTTGEQLVAHKKGVPPEAKVNLASLVRMIDGVASEAGVTVEEVLPSKRLRTLFARAQRAVDRDGEGATLRADHAGQLADAAGLTPHEVWGDDVFTEALSQLTKTVTLPDGTQHQVDNRITVGNLGYDVTLTLDGSFRAAHGLADDQTRAELDAIYTDTAMEILGWLEDTTAYGMRGHHGDGQSAEITPGNGFAGWSMFHRTARPVDGAAMGDPHWHVHFTLANMTRGADGKWSTIASGGRDLMRHAPVVDRLLQAAVRDVLTRRYGVHYRRSERTGRWEIAEIPDEAIRLFSQRGQSIDQALIKMGLSPEEAGAAVRRVAASVTRERRNQNATAPDETLAGHWRRQALDAGIDPDLLTRHVFRTPPAIGPAATSSPQRPTLKELATLLQDIESGLTSNTRRFSRAEAIAAVADALPAGGTHTDIIDLTEQVLQHAGFIKLPFRASTGSVEPTHGERRQLAAEHMANADLYTTSDVVDIEKIIIAAAQASNPDQTPIRVDRDNAIQAADAIEAANGFPLSNEQRRELLRIVTSGRGLDTLVGGPGAGKTTLMDAVRAAYETDNLVVAGAATQGVTAQTLQAESGIPSRTIAQWLWRVDNGPGLRGVDVLVIDEAGMVNDRDRARLYTAAADAGAKILEIGDPKQLRGVGVGSSFGVVHSMLGGGELADNRRQADVDERAALAAWRREDYSAALTSWADRDRMVVTETGQEAVAALLATWVDQRQGAPDAFTEQRGLLMVAAANETVARLNDGAQALRLIAGELGRHRTYALAGGDKLTLHENDYVMVRVNERNQTGPDVLNGYRGVIDTINDDGSLAVRWERATEDGRLVESAVLPPQFVAKGGLSPGYAITIHKSQGLTVGSDGATWTGPDDEQRGGAVLFHAVGADNPGSYVAMSRHKLAMWLFLARKDVETPQDEHLLGLPRTTWGRTRRVITKLVERAEATATNRNDIPVLVDLGHLDLPATPKDRPAPPDDDLDLPDDHHWRQALRAKAHAAEIVRRAKAEALLTREWGEHPAVDRVTKGDAFRTIARWLDHVDNEGGNPALLVREIDPDDMIAPHVRDPSRLAASLIKTAARHDPRTTGPRPMTKAQRRARAESAEHARRAETSALLRQEWGEHPAVDSVTSGPAFGAVVHNLAAAASDLDPRIILRAIHPDTVVRPRIHNPSAYTAARIRALADNPTPPAAPAPRIPEQPGLPHQALTRLEQIVPSYESTLAQLATRPAPAHDTLAGAPTPNARRDALWPSWLPTPPPPHTLTGRDRALAAAATTDARRIRARAIKLGRHAARDRPDWVQALGPPPDGATARAHYLVNITTIAAYRELHTITGPDPLGPEPDADHTPPAYAAAQHARRQLAQSAARTTPPTPEASTESPTQDVAGPRTRETEVTKRLTATRERAQRLADLQHDTRQPPITDTRPQHQEHGHRPGY
ncbi:MobF family relaxase [Actinokineospora cianjurensis]|uniref:Conjugative relaxase-like TrwC/TraI family protein n=1 Tax=Actinokineospora cianjurensis TaxID=585224 RepID=A0A421B232_9PSEU|nr:MobF family relaxase [Actinokineospora cianjurensis]RLK58430.1 conjugative relaxase-like TrwC/TraI family protein [Actinokineospora cianjurensis]